MIKTVELAECIPSVSVHYGSPKEGEVHGTRHHKGTGAEIIDTLQNDHGLQVLVTQGPGRYTEGNYAQGYVVLPDGHRDLEVPLNAIRVVRDISGVMGTEGQATKALDTAGSLILNGPAIRRYDNKRTAVDVFGNHQSPTVAVDASTQLVDLLNSATGSLFIKPSRGAAGKHVHRIIPGEDLPDIDWSIKHGYVLQPEIRHNGQLPASIKFLDRANKEKANILHNANKEMRLYWFCSSGKPAAVIPVLRYKDSSLSIADATKKEELVFIDPDTMPEELMSLTEKFLEALHQQTGVAEISGAFDFVYGSIHGEDERWWVMEGNFWQPVPPTKKQNEIVRREFIVATTAQIARVALSKVGEK